MSREQGLIGHGLVWRGKHLISKVGVAYTVGVQALGCKGAFPCWQHCMHTVGFRRSAAQPRALVLQTASKERCASSMLPSRHNCRCSGAMICSARCNFVAGPHSAVCRRRPPGAFAGNELVTSKYNLLNFIPVNLYHQFKRVANMYFAALVCLQVCHQLVSPLQSYMYGLRPVACANLRGDV